LKCAANRTQWPCATKPSFSAQIIRRLLIFPFYFDAIPGYTNVVGKAVLGRVPLWGRIFRSVYLTVDRRSAVSRGRSLLDSARSLRSGRDLIIFPEGTIGPHPGRVLLPFKDGAFRLAIENQFPIVPVTMPYNHRFFPELGGRLRLRRHRFLTIFHPPIHTTGLTVADIPKLRDQVRAIIASCLDPASEPIDSPFPPPLTTESPATVPDATSDLPPDLG
jgi:1-acyl-sn-glycerol-3-phosphate acyltransferase